MARWTGAVGDIFPNGTSVGAYTARQRSKSDGAPTGLPVELATVDGNSLLTFENLAAHTDYVAAGIVGGRWRYVEFLTPGHWPGMDEEVLESGLPYIDVEDKDYGADVRADGDWNDPAIRAALLAAQGEGAVLLKQRYTVSGLAIPSDSWIVCMGGGGFKADVDASNWPVYCEQGFDNIRIDNPVIDGNAAAIAAAHPEYSVDGGAGALDGGPHVAIEVGYGTVPSTRFQLNNPYYYDQFRLGIVLQSVQDFQLRHVRGSRGGRDGLTLFNDCWDGFVHGLCLDDFGDDLLGINSDEGMCRRIRVLGGYGKGPSTRLRGRACTIRGGDDIAISHWPVKDVGQSGFVLEAGSSESPNDLTNVRISSCPITNPGTNGSADAYGFRFQANEQTSNDNHIRHVVIDGCPVTGGRAGSGGSAFSFRDYRGGSASVDAIEDVRVYRSPGKSLPGNGVEFADKGVKDLYFDPESGMESCGGMGFLIPIGKGIRIHAPAKGNAGVGVHFFAVEDGEIDSPTIVDNGGVGFELSGLLGRFLLRVGELADNGGIGYSLGNGTHNASLETFGPWRILTGAVLWDIPSTADGATSTQDVTVAGAAVGCPVKVGHTTVLPAGTRLWAQVISANTVRVYFENRSGGAVNPASGTAYVHVEMPPPV